MTVALVAYRARRDVPELPGGVLRDDCRTPILESQSTSSRPIATTRELAAAARPVLDRVREAIAARHYSRRTERAYAGWVDRYLSFHRGRTAEEMAEPEIVQFLSALATRGQVTASTQNQALSALLFLYRDVLGRELHGLDAIRAKPSIRLPIVLSKEEVSRVLRHLHGTPWLMMSLMYGAGLRLLECARLRVKDLDFDRSEITIRDGKGRKDRVSVLPTALSVPLQRHLERRRLHHIKDCSGGSGHVALPDALDRKYPNATEEWAWQWVFPAARVYVHGPTGKRRRRHVHESVLQRAFRDAVRAAGLTKPATCHTLRHYAGCRIMPGGIADRPQMGGSLAA